MDGYKIITIGDCDFYDTGKTYINRCVSEDCMKTLCSLLEDGTEAVFEFGMNKNDVWPDATKACCIFTYKGRYPVIAYKRESGTYIFHEECLVRITDKNGKVLYEKT